MRPRIDVRNIVSAQRADARRPRRASSPAASIRRSSRWCASIARPVRRFPRTCGRRSPAGSCAALGRAAMRCSCPTTAPASSRRRWCAAPSACCAGPGGAQPPVLVDSRYALLDFRGMTMCTPNESEVEQLLGIRIGENARVLERAGRQLLERTRPPGRADHARQPRHGAVRAGPRRRCTFRSSAPIRSPTSPARATP